MLKACSRMPRYTSRMARLSRTSPACSEDSILTSIWIFCILNYWCSILIWCKKLGTLILVMPLCRLVTSTFHWQRTDRETAHFFIQIEYQVVPDVAMLHVISVCISSSLVTWWCCTTCITKIGHLSNYHKNHPSLANIPCLMITLMSLTLVIV